MVELTGKATILDILANSVQAYHRALVSDNLKFVEIYKSLAEDLYWIARDDGIPAIETAMVFVGASPIHSRKKVLAVLTSKYMLSQKDARRIEIEFGIPAPPSSRVRRT